MSLKSQKKQKKLFNYIYTLLILQQIEARKEKIETTEIFYINQMKNEQEKLNKTLAILKKRMKIKDDD